VTISKYLLISFSSFVAPCLCHFWTVDCPQHVRCQANFSLSAIPGYDLVLPRCQLVICCGASVRLSYMYWMTSILVSGTWRCTLI